MAENKWQEENIDIDGIILDENIQVRVKTDLNRVKEFVQIFDQLPPIKIVREKDKNYLADGKHRYLAAKERGEKTMLSSVLDGKYSDALEVSVRENAKGSLNLTREDRRRAIEKMLEFFPQRANTWIAEDVGVAMQTVEVVRKELEAKGTIKHLDDLIRRDQKTTPREYQRPIKTEVSRQESITNREGDIAIVEDNLSKSEMEDLLRLSTRALGKQYSSPASERTAQTNPLTMDTLESMNKAIASKLGKSSAQNSPDGGKEEELFPSGAKKSDVTFVGDDEGLIAELVDSEERRGMRARSEGAKIAINVYEVMKEPRKLFPKAGAQFELYDFGEFLRKCVAYFEEQAK